MRTAAAVSILLLSAPLAPAATPRPLEPVVEVEEEVYSYEPPGNGSGPLWCHGSTCICRIGERVFASGIETIPGAKPLNNVRWTLHERAGEGWKLVRRDEEGRTREPSPIASFPDGRIFLSVNPTLASPDSYSGPAEPRILAFSSVDIAAPPRTLLPVWSGPQKFTEHSYRSFAADGPSGELILIQNIGYTHASWAFLDRDGTWAAQGRITWPWGTDYPEPKPIRVCYPTVALRDRAVHFCGVSDIVEPYPQWRAHKRELTGRDWDYDFRRLFYTWSDDIRSRDFHDWVEVSSRDRTAGWIFPCDLRVAPDGSVQILWSERAIDERLREKFFPEAKQRIALEYAVLRRGKVESRRPILEWREGGGDPAPGGGPVPGQGRFHETPDGRLFVFFHVGGTDETGKALSENRIVEIPAEGPPGGAGGSGADAPGRLGPAVRVPLKAPFTSFFTTTARAGSAPSSVLDVLGEGGKPAAVRYARIRLRP